MNQGQQNIYAFIDSQNLNLAIRDLGWRLDFKKFLIYLKAKYKVNKAFLFIGHLPENEKLYQQLKKFGYELIFKPVVKHNKKELTKGNVDAELVLHAAKIEFYNYDKAIVISNDGDFYCLIDHLIEENKFLKLITPNNKYSSLLRKFSAFMTTVLLFRHKVEYTKKEAFPRHG